MSQFSIICAECGFTLTYNLIDESEMDITEFVLFGKAYLCKHCSQRRDTK